jgi:hypothetical protein
MHYNAAKTLHSGDEVILSATQETLFVKEIEVLWQFEKVRLGCVKTNGEWAYAYNDEVE